MTYTVIGRCGTSGRLGIAIATYSLAVGGYCPSIRAGVGAVSTQAFVNPGLGPLALRLMALGYRAEKVMAELAESDPEFDWRQIALIDRDGGAVAHTGRNTRPWSGHVTADGVVAMGNVLAGEAVVTAIAEGFEASAGEGLDERLLRALEAGRDAGGQQGADGHLPERSAGLLVYDRHEYALLDLRVDAHEAAVDELRRIHGVYAPYIPYYELRHRAPAETPAQDVWARERGL